MARVIVSLGVAVLLASEPCHVQSATVHSGMFYNDTQCSSKMGSYKFTHIGGNCYQKLDSPCDPGDHHCSRSFIIMCGFAYQMIDIYYVDDKCGEEFGSEGYPYKDLSTPVLAKCTYSFADWSRGSCTAATCSKLPNLDETSFVEHWRSDAALEGHDIPACRQPVVMRKMNEGSTQASLLYATTQCDDTPNFFTKQVTSNCFAYVSATGKARDSSVTMTCDAKGVMWEEYDSHDCSGDPNGNKYESKDYKPTSVGVCTTTTFHCPPGINCTSSGAASETWNDKQYPAMLQSDISFCTFDASASITQTPMVLIAASGALLSALFFG